MIRYGRPIFIGRIFVWSELFVARKFSDLRREVESDPERNARVINLQRIIWLVLGEFEQLVSSLLSSPVADERFRAAWARHLAGMSPEDVYALRPDDDDTVEIVEETPTSFANACHTPTVLCCQCNTVIRRCGCARHHLKHHGEGMCSTCSRQ